jgi:hypothetical protein
MRVHEKAKNHWGMFFGIMVVELESGWMEELCFSFYLFWAK